MCTKLFKLGFAVAFILASVNLNAQKPSKKAAEFFKNQNYLGALPIYQSLLEKDSLNVEFATNAAKCMLNINMDKTEAIPILERLVVNNAAEGEVFFLLAKAYTFKYDFESSSKMLMANMSTIPEEMKPEAERMIRNNESAKQLMMDPINVEFENLGPKVNSPYPDYYPYVTNEESKLVFTSRRKKSGTMIEFDGYYNSDIFMVQNLSSTYPKTKNMGNSINTNLDEQSVGLSPNGIDMMVYIDHVNEYGDIYLSQWSTSRYTPYQKLGPNVNSEGLETSASFSEDGNTLFFASKREGGYGGLDLYMSRKLPDGTWGKSQNLGPKVNTPFNEDFPFLSEDSKLYFSSNGHPGMGGYDLFVTDWDPETNKWGKADNLGYPINTPEDNRTISFNKDRSHAYVSCFMKEGQGDLDIYRVIFKDETMIPALFEVEVLKNATEEFLSPDVSIFDQNDNLFGTYKANSYNNKYIISLMPGTYKILVEQDGYLEIYEDWKVNASDAGNGLISRKLFMSAK